MIHLLVPAALLAYGAKKLYDKMNANNSGSSLGFGSESEAVRSENERQKALRNGRQQEQLNQLICGEVKNLAGAFLGDAGVPKRYPVDAVKAFCAVNITSTESANKALSVLCAKNMALVMPPSNATALEHNLQALTRLEELIEKV